MQVVSDSTSEGDEQVPPDLSEIKAIIELVNGPIMKALEHMQTAQDEMRKLIEQLSNKIVRLEERIAAVEKENIDLSKQLEEMRDEILDNQKRKFQQTIALQASILLMILGAFVTYFFTVILPQR